MHTVVYVHIRVHADMLIIQYMNSFCVVEYLHVHVSFTQIIPNEKNHIQIWALDDDRKLIPSVQHHGRHFQEITCMTYMCVHVYIYIYVYIHMEFICYLYVHVYKLYICACIYLYIYISLSIYIYVYDF